MPRWLVTAVLAFVLCCLGFSAAAQGYAGARQHGCDATASVQALEQVLSKAFDAGTSSDSGDESPGNDEQRHDCSEILIGFPGPFVPVTMSEPAAPPPPALGASAFLEHPKRPPRA
jgi:hypothetical protein